MRSRRRAENGRGEDLWQKLVSILRNETELEPFSGLSDGRAAAMRWGL